MSQNDSELAEAQCKVVRFWRHCFQKGSVLILQSYGSRDQALRTRVGRLMPATYIQKAEAVEPLTELY